MALLKPTLRVYLPQGRGFHKVFNVLISKGVIRICWFFMSVWTFLSSLTFSFHPEGAKVWSIPFVVGVVWASLSSMSLVDVAFPNMPTGRVPSELEIYRGMTHSEGKLHRLCQSPRILSSNIKLYQASGSTPLSPYSVCSTLC